MVRAHSLIWFVLTRQQCNAGVRTFMFKLSMSVLSVFAREAYTI